jgi:hypothetical protein
MLLLSIFSVKLFGGVAENSLIAYWSFDSTDQSEKYYDMTGNGFDAVTNQFGLTDGVVGRALDCNGGYRDIIITNSVKGFNVAAFSIECWIYSYVNLVEESSDYNFKSIFEYTLVGIDTPVTGGYNLQLSDRGGLYCGMANSTTDGKWEQVESQETLLPRTWYHVAATYNGSVIRLFINGKLVKEQAYAGGVKASPIAARIGSQLRVSDTVPTAGKVIDRFNGIIDELKLYNYAVSAEEMSAHYAQVYVPLPAKELIAYWSFDTSIYNKQFYDVTGNGYTATCSKQLALKPGVTGKALESTVKGYDLFVENSCNGFSVPTYSIEAWIYPYGNLVASPSDTNYKAVFSYQTFSPGIAKGYSLEITNEGRIMFANANTGTTWSKCIGTTVLTPETWYHVVGTYDGSALKVYLNGKLETAVSQPSGYIVPDQNANIACQAQIKSGEVRNWFSGRIDELMLFNYALSEDTVARHYGSVQPPASEKRVLAHWSFDSSSYNKQFFDVTGNGYTANCSKPLATQPGVKGKALESTQSGYTFYVANSNGNFSVPTFSIEAWVYSYIDLVNIGSFYNFKSVFSYQTFSTGVAKGYHLDITDAGEAQLSMAATSGTWACCVGKTVLKPRTWYHLTGTYDGCAMKIYVNGNLDNSISQSNGYVVPDQDANIACQAQVKSGEIRNWFNGMIDELKLYNYPLDASAVKTSYETLLPEEVPSFEINLGMKTVHAKAGDTVIMPVYIANYENFDISAVQLVIAYEPSQLTLQSIVTDSGLVKDWLFDWNATTKGSVPVALAGQQVKLNYGEGELIRCTFVVSESVGEGDTCEIKIENVNIDENKDLVLSSTQNGKIVIAGDAILYGDVSGNREVSSYDAQLVLKYVVGAITLPNEICPNFTLAVADVSGNGLITSYDAACILQYSIGLIPSFPVERGESLLGKRRAVAQTQTAANAQLDIRLQSDSDNQLVYNLVGTNMCGFRAGEFAIECIANPDVFAYGTITTFVKGAKLSSKFNSVEQMLKIAVITNDDIDNDSAVTIARITLPPTPEAQRPKFTIKTVWLNEGTIPTNYGNGAIASTKRPPVTVTPMVQPSVTFTDNRLSVHLTEPGDAMLSIYDLRGRKVLRQTVPRTNAVFPVGDCGKGTYIYTLEQEGNRLTGKIMTVDRP